jgi:hypothetical protein
VPTVAGAPNPEAAVMKSRDDSNTLEQSALDEVNATLGVTR